MSGLTDYAEKYLLDYLFAANVYVALHTGDPGEDATANEVDTGTEDADYVRKVVTMGAATLGVGKSVSTTSVSWTIATTSPGYTITHISLWDALAGNALFKGELLTPKPVIADEVYTMNAGLITAQLD